MGRLGVWGFCKMPFVPSKSSTQHLRTLSRARASAQIRLKPTVLEESWSPEQSGGSNKRGFHKQDGAVGVIYTYINQ